MSTDDRYAEHIALLVRCRAMSYEVAQETLAAIEHLQPAATTLAKPAGGAEPPSESALHRARFVLGEIDENQSLEPFIPVVRAGGWMYGAIVGLAVAAVPVILKVGFDKAI